MYSNQIVRVKIASHLVIKSEILTPLVISSHREIIKLIAGTSMTRLELINFSASIRKLFLRVAVRAKLIMYAYKQ